MIPDTFGEWLRWAAGIFFTIQSALIGHLYYRIDSIRSGDDERQGSNLKLVWTELSKLRDSIELDRQRAADSRAALAASIVTRDEMDRQINRLVSSVNMQIAALARIPAIRPLDPPL